MMRHGSLFWLAVAVIAGLVTFKVKYAVQEVEDELRRVRSETRVERQEIRVLSADWAYLNQPERLADLNRQFLALPPITTKQLEQRIADLPMRARSIDQLLTEISEGR